MHNSRWSSTQVTSSAPERLCLLRSTRTLDSHPACVTVKALLGRPSPANSNEVVCWFQTEIALDYGVSLGKTKVIMRRAV